MLIVGATQHMHFVEGDIGPYLMSEEQRQARKYDIDTGKTKNPEKLRVELEADLKANDSEFQVRKGMNKKDLQEECIRVGIPIRKMVPIIQEGWLGKPKGLLQVCYEWGLIDGSLKYGVGSRKDAFGNFIEGTDPQELLAACDDFESEETLLLPHLRKRSDDLY